MAIRVLTVNTGSSSVKLALFRAEGGALREIAVERLSGASDLGQASASFLEKLGAQAVDCVVHRVVHGGARLTSTRILDEETEREIRALTPLAPLHQPRALAFIAACRARWPAARALAVFDTAFFAELPEVARTYALPRALSSRLGLRRYGFHGLAHQSMVRAYARERPELSGGGKVISFQLGSGCSVAAISRGRPLDTSMGFTPLEGLVMATRAGDLDPGLVLYLAEHEGLSLSALEEMLSHESGLKGLAGGSGDLRALLDDEGPAARLAVKLYGYRARKYLGAYLAVLDGADAILFGGGVGEHVPQVRAAILEGLHWFEIALSRERNERPAEARARPRRISADGSRTEIYVVPVDEERLLAEAASQFHERKLKDTRSP